MSSRPAPRAPDARRAPAPGERRPRPPEAPTVGFRADIEGLRAVAVVAVIAFHVHVAGFSGGFVGVDVFFVLSGYLITGLLLGELHRTGTLHLPTFWARRARRLLPASALVIVATVVASRWMLPPLAQRAVATDALGAATFVVNFVFAHRLGDYFGAQLGQLEPSPLLHFWSLAVEEQFYLLWPLSLFVLARRPRQLRRLLLGAVLVLAAVSLLVSVWWTRTQPTWAFYLLPARAFELLAGAAVAVAGGAFRAVSPTWRAALGWFGLAGIVLTVLTFDSSTAFPGTAALAPVLCTVLVIVAGGPGSAPRGPQRALRHPLGLWIGRHSYALYLWHWPALVLAEARWGPLSMMWRIVAVAVAVGLAALSTRFVENPIRFSPWLAARAGRGLALGGALCVLGVATAWIAWADEPSLDSGRDAAAPVLDVAGAAAPTSVTAASNQAAPTSVGAAPEPLAAAPPAPLPALTGADLPALVAANQQVLAAGLAAGEVPANLRPSLAASGGDRAAVYADGCVNIGVDAELHDCRYGIAGSATTIVLYGDSHAAQWFPAALAVAEQRGAELVVLTKGGCPTADVPIPTNTLARTCPQWRDAAVQRVAELRPDLLLVTGWSDYPNSDEEWATGFEATIARLAPSAGQLVVLGDNPRTQDVPGSCLSAHVHDTGACVASAADVVEIGRIEAERAVAEAHGGRFVDTTDWFCVPAPDGRCPVIIGDVLMYRDVTHITTVAAGWFAPLLAAALA